MERLTVVRERNPAVATLAEYLERLFSTGISPFLRPTPSGAFAIRQLSVRVEDAPFIAVTWAFDTRMGDSPVKLSAVLEARAEHGIATQLDGQWLVLSPSRAAKPICTGRLIAATETSCAPSGRRARPATHAPRRPIRDIAGVGGNWLPYPPHRYLT
jgi:hypothetical protein